LVSLGFRVTYILVNDATCDVSVVVQTSGSGKTRTLLEGLCRRWGFYFTCTTNTALVEGNGSRDLYSVAMSSKSRLHYLSGLSDAVCKEALNKNRRQTSHRIACVLKARFRFLESFLQVAQECNITDHNYLRQRWVYLQLSPLALYQSRILLQEELHSFDIFRSFAEQFSGAPPEYLETGTEWDRICTLLKQPYQDPVVILDEAQQVAQSHKEFFRDTAGILPSSIVRELAVAFGSAGSLIVCGTDVPLSEVKEATSSTVAKLGATFKVFRDLGGFDDRNKIKAYVAYYVPEDVVTERLLDRLCLWLQGRYVQRPQRVHVVVAEH
jgi:hypothetical protein